MSDQAVSVSDLTYAIQRILGETFDVISVRGEISNFKTHSSGHRYFTLKDSGAQINCTLWRGRNINFKPADGMEVVVKGKVTIYPPRGQYQLEAFTMQPLGSGDLYLAFEALKRKLEAKGYFSPERKRPIPGMVFRVSVVTSPTGAAVRDIFSVIERRFALCEIYFRPAIVQGDDAAADVARAIEELNREPVEAIIVGRGGGSLEDLWAFNEETVADAIFKSKKPIISAVGHETDFSISDFVADVRAATPTAAAELVTPIAASDILADMDYKRRAIRRGAISKIENYEDLLDRLSGDYAFRRAIENINVDSQMVDDLTSDLQIMTKRTIEDKIRDIEHLSTLCASLDPKAPLRKGYALLKTEDGLISSRRSLKDFLEIKVERNAEIATVKIENVIEK